MTTTGQNVLAMLSEEALHQATECLKIIAHPVRIQLIRLLLQGRYPVGELAALLSLAPHVTSEHLRLMERCGLLKSEREGRRVFYCVAESGLQSIIGCIEKRFGTHRFATNQDSNEFEQGE